MVHFVLATNALTDQCVPILAHFLLSTRVLQQLDIRGNDIDPGLADDVDLSLLDQGSSLFVRWDEYSEPNPYLRY